MRKKVEVERFCCDSCGVWSTHYSKQWKEAIVDGHPHELCTGCGNAVDELIHFMRNVLNLDVIIKDLPIGEE